MRKHCKKICQHRPLQRLWLVSHDATMASFPTSSSSNEGPRCDTGAMQAREDTAFCASMLAVPLALPVALSVHHKHITLLMRCSVVTLIKDFFTRRKRSIIPATQNNTAEDMIHGAHGRRPRDKFSCLDDALEGEDGGREGGLPPLVAILRHTCGRPQLPAPRIQDCC